MPNLVLPTDFDRVEVLTDLRGNVGCDNPAAKEVGVVFWRGERYTAVGLDAVPLQDEFDYLAQKARYAFSRQEKAHA